MKHVLLNNISGAAVLVTVTLVFTMVFEPRYSRKRYLQSLVPFLAVLLGVNFYVIFHYGFTRYGGMTLFIATLPSLIYFYLVSQHRDGRFFFTFCLVDTSSIWLATVSGVLDYMVGAEGILNFVLRVLSLPVILYVVKRWMRRPFLTLLHTVNKGWWLFTAMTGMVYLLLICLTSYPTNIRERTDDIPMALLLMIFLPLTYATIFYVLISQHKLHDMGTLQHAFSAQSAMIESRAREFRAAEDKLRIQRHDMRHQLKVLEAFAQQNQRQEALEYLGVLQKGLDDTALPHYCTNPILDAILSSYIHQAEEADIRVEARLALPDQLPVPAVELATVLANALENAIHACLELPEDQRRIVFVCTSQPGMILRLENPYQGQVIMDENHMPVTQTAGHGVGMRSITAFCKKHDAVCDCRAENGWFSLMINL